METHAHLTAVIDALTAWRDSLAAPVIEPEPKPPAPVIERKPKPARKTVDEIAAEAERIAKRIAHYRFLQHKGIFLDMKRRCRARKSEINFAAGAPSLIDVSWGGRYTPSQWVVDKQKATIAEGEQCGFPVGGRRHG